MRYLASILHKIAVFLSLTLVLTSCSLYDWVAPPKSDLTVIKAVDGVLKATLVATPTPMQMGGLTLPGQTYNGVYTGPVFWVKRGDVMKIKLVNNLTKATNLHFHGLYSSPLENSDNVHIVVDPGETYDYEVRIPESQPPGFYWYHAHIHGISEEQVGSGLSGAIFVEGTTDEMEQLKGLNERLIVVKDFALDMFEDNPIADDQWHDRIVTINGKTDSVIHLQPGQSEIWHIGNHSANFPYTFKIPGQKLRMIAIDCVLVHDEQVVDSITVLPAGRMSVLVTAGDKPGDYPVNAEGVLTGSGATYAKYRTLATVSVSGAPVAALTKLTGFPVTEDLRTKPIAQHREVVFTQNNKTQKFYMNNKLFDINRIDLRVPLGTYEEWIIKNETDDIHVFHIHQLHFQVLEMNGHVLPEQDIADVYRIPAHGSIKIILPFTNPLMVGRFMYHCHVLNHEDHGMMAHIEVYDPSKALSLEEEIRQSICRPTLTSRVPELGDVL